MDASLKAALLKQIRSWHWISAGFCMISLLMFAITGFLLNHENWFKFHPQVTDGVIVIRKHDLADLAQSIKNKTFTPSFSAFLEKSTDITINKADIEWEEDEIYLNVASAGKSAWVSILPESGQIEFERTDYGLVVMLKDLHTGRHSGAIWRRYIDMFAFMCVVFSITGLLLLFFYQSQRPATWAVVSTGFVVPIVIILLFIHL